MREWWRTSLASRAGSCAGGGARAGGRLRVTNVQVHLSAVVLNVSATLAHALVGAFVHAPPPPIGCVHILSNACVLRLLPCVFVCVTILGVCMRNRTQGICDHASNGGGGGGTDTVNAVCVCVTK